MLSNQTRVPVVWLTLVGLTIASYALGTGHGLPGDGRGVGLVILVIAVFKARLVGLHFMELRMAPIGLRSAFEAFCVAQLVMLVTFYLA